MFRNMLFRFRAHIFHFVFFPVAATAAYALVFSTFVVLLTIEGAAKRVQYWTPRENILNAKQIPKVKMQNYPCVLSSEIKKKEYTHRHRHTHTQNKNYTDGIRVRWGTIEMVNEMKQRRGERQGKEGFMFPMWDKRKLYCVGPEHIVYIWWCT